MDQVNSQTPISIDGRSWWTPRLVALQAWSVLNDAEKMNKTAVEVEVEEELPVSKFGPYIKRSLNAGLFANQPVPEDITETLTREERDLLRHLPDLTFGGKPNKALPLPLGPGLALLVRGRDFKLPYEICSPVPAEGPDLPYYRHISENQWTKDALAVWKKHGGDDDGASKCVCSPETGCAEDCHNRSMLYECTRRNCNVGAGRCKNRAFDELQERLWRGGAYRVGVDVFQTQDRGFGLRSTRAFEPGQLITEYVGEIITQAECQKRMAARYSWRMVSPCGPGDGLAVELSVAPTIGANKLTDKQNLYVMSWDSKLSIDATRGGPARFVNHSCQPNCRMVKWQVDGQPRIGLFASDPIGTGDELTYDYNFDSFTDDKVVKCLCGRPNCRGSLTPASQDVRVPKPAPIAVPAAAVATAAATPVLKPCKRALPVDPEETEEERWSESTPRKLVKPGRICIRVPARGSPRSA